MDLADPARVDAVQRADTKETTRSFPAIPPEIMWHIQAQLGCARDHAACVLASRLFSVPLLRRLIRRVSAPDLLRAGAPLAVIERACIDLAAVDARGLIHGAAQYDRADVIAWIYGRVTLKDVVIVDFRDTAPVHFPSTPKAHRSNRWKYMTTLGSERERRYTGAAINAMYDAAYYGSVGALRWLLERHFPRTDAPAGPLERTLFAALVLNAASGPAQPTTTLNYLHHYGATRFPPVHDMYRGRVCACPMRTWEAAAASNRVATLAWLSATGCSGRFNPGLVSWTSHTPGTGQRQRQQQQHQWHPLAEAVRQGDTDVAVWFADMMGVSRWPSADPVLMKALARAAKMGHVDTLRVFHGLGAQQCPSSAILKAAKMGQTSVLRWAMGDGDSACAAEPRVPGWPSPSIGCAAAAYGRTSTVQWLAERPDAKVNFGVGAHVCAVRRIQFDVVRVLVDARIIPFDQWDPLCVAVEGRSHLMVRYVAERGATCNARALSRAICQDDPTNVAFLCDHYGTENVQAALDLLAGCCDYFGGVKWVRDHVPRACVAQVGTLCWLACRCPRCRTTTTTTTTSPAPPP